MSLYFGSDRGISIGALPPLKAIYPWATMVSFVYPERGSAIPPHSLRRRSRGPHSPGDGAYFCSHISPPGGVSGFRSGNTILVTNLDRLYVPGSTQKWYEFHQKVWSVESFRSNGYGTHYYYESYVLQALDQWGRPTYSRTRWKFDDGYHRIPLEDAKSRAFASEPERTSYAVGFANNYRNPSGTLKPAEFDNHYVEDQIREGTIPNLSSYLNDAYIAAFESLPHIGTNNIANILTIYSFLGSCLNTYKAGRLVTEVGTVKDAWLGYRYAYSTTKGDILELVSYCDRMRNFRKMKQVTGHGATRVAVGGSEYTFKCALSASVDDYLNIYNSVERYGLALDGYNVWDMIPYSFIVDWFLHIGDILETARSRNYAMRLKPSAVWYSMTHEFTNSFGCNQCDYYRWPGHVDFSVLPSSILRHGGSSSTTWVKRAADAVCLL